MYVVISCIVSVDEITHANGIMILQEDTQFQDAVFNDTISIVEPDEGLDGET